MVTDKQSSKKIIQGLPDQQNDLTLDKRLYLLSFPKIGVL